MTFDDIKAITEKAQRFTFLLDVEPRPAPRPVATGKFTKNRKPIVRMPIWYKHYKQAIIDGVREYIDDNPEIWENFPSKHIFGYTIQIITPYPKGTPREHLLPERLSSKKQGDLDNFAKGILDALQDEVKGIIDNDNIFSYGQTISLRSENGAAIMLTLYAEESYSLRV